MTTLFLIRHAQAEGNLYRIAQGHFDSCITALGYRQIDALAERFKNVHLDALYSSDLRRTRTTATAITRYHDLEMHTTPPVVGHAPPAGDLPRRVRGHELRRHAKV